MTLSVGQYHAWGWQPWEIAQKTGVPVAEVEAIIAQARTSQAAHVDLTEFMDHEPKGAQPKPDQNGAARELATIRASKVAPERVTWLWPGRIPAGKLTVFDGDPGLGKSTITLDVAARLTTGSPLPDGHRPDRAVKVALLGAEDGVADTIVPRLAAAGADRDAIEIIEHVTDADGARPVELPADIDRLTDFIGEQDIKLVILDPLMAFLAGGVDAHRDQDVRRVLHRLKLMAEETGAALLPIRHLNKVAGGNPLYRGGGSIGIVGAARAGLLVAPDPGDETGARRVLAVTKSNLAAMPDSLVYRVIGDEVYDVARIAWDGAVELSAADLLGVPVVEHDSPKRDQAEELLRDLLAKGPMSREDLEHRAEDAFVSLATLKRAAANLGVQVERRPEKGKRGRGPAWWSLPNTAHGHDGQLSMDDDADPQVTEANTDQANTAQPANTTGEPYSIQPEPQVAEPEPAVEANTAHRLMDGRADAARPRRIQLQRTKGWKLPEGAIRVDRGARKPLRRYANPYDWQEHGRGKAVELYRERHLTTVAATAPGDLGGHDLACWCPPGEPCHADMLLLAANPHADVLLPIANPPEATP